jgi:hypothetical protein
MNRLITAVAAVPLLLVCASSGIARAEGPPAEHMSGGLGFHDASAPVGVRWWLGSQKVGIDVGFGYGSASAVGAGYPDEKVSHWAIDGGVPIVFKSWSKVHVILRPGILYQSQAFVSSTPPAPFATEDGKTLTVSGEVEAEVFLADNFSVSASHGIAYESINPPGPGDNITSFTTVGNNFTNVGFHVYFLGGHTE